LHLRERAYMKTREQIIAEIVRQYEKDDQPAEHYEALAEDRGQSFVDNLHAEKKAYPGIVRGELAKRLTEDTYLTCDDFDHFDVTCCDTCHTCYPHYEMWIVKLSDGHHAWVCDPIEHILMRRTKTVPSSPEDKEKLALLGDIFGGWKPDPVEDELHAASMAATTDEQKLYYCIKYAHHVHKRKRGHKSIETLVGRALRLPGRGPAKSSKTA
jgi:hypothetical protein